MSKFFKKAWAVWKADVTDHAEVVAIFTNRDQALMMREYLYAEDEKTRIETGEPVEHYRYFVSKIN